ncbi:phenylphosphate carboxylase subunit delta [Halioglobus sp. HI00S01]|uniref:KdsC family phosphatase n=1 Tax=Halioglobus sp. HI00S01 TaxID=1822214 RepID=UPI0007C40D01|nr:HAD-IIIA family hydrolase [Halioglobus sp. HI00S01]KZX59524.1 phenylphosphate carboxylase subunit delta [Halioglobus sp. HI00S01]
MIHTEIAQSLKLLALDVDGVLTDGCIYYGNNGEELKSFNIKDGLGIKLLQRGGVDVVIITGRQSEIVARRARELGITDVIQGREDKLVALQALCDSRGIELRECAYMGDDLPDLAAVRAAGLGLTVSDGATALHDAADWVSEAAGGRGAVREAGEWILHMRGSLDTLLAEFN